MWVERVDEGYYYRVIIYLEVIISIGGLGWDVSDLMEVWDLEIKVYFAID